LPGCDSAKSSGVIDEQEGDKVFQTLKAQYDYIIVTAPVSLVTDTLLIAKHADTFIYVARANFLEKRMLNIPTVYTKNKIAKHVSAS
jgi:Mrp family chromosome partitioning ATPase